MDKTEGAVEARRATTPGTGFEFPPPLPAEGETASGSGDPGTRPLDFPSLANPHVVSVATATLLEGEALEGFDPDDPQAVASVAELMTMATAQANTGYFRFALREVHAPGQPEAVTLGPHDPIVGLSEEASTRKITMLLVLAVTTPSGECRLTVPTFGKEVTLSPGTLVMFPAYLVPALDLSAGETVTGLLSYASGNAFQ